MNLALYGQISDETWYTWWHLALTTFKTINTTAITQTYIYFSPFTFLVCLLSLDLFPPFIALNIFTIILSIAKM